MMGHLEKPKPMKVGASIKKPKSYNIFTVSSIHKHGAFSSAVDFSSSTRKAKTQMETNGDATMFPLLSESSGYAAALMPEARGNSPMQKQGNSSKMHLRFPILSPTREESIILNRMKTMHKATKLSQSDPNLLMVTKVPNNNSNWKTPERHKIELEKVSPFPMRDSKSRSVLTSRGGFMSTGRSSQTTQNEEVDTRLLMQKEKTIAPSKHGYHPRSHSATFKRLDRVRKSLDDLVEEQVVEFQDKMDLEDILEDMSNVDPHEYGSRLTPLALEEGLPTIVPRSSHELPFHLNRSVYELNDDATMNMTALYKEDPVRDKPNSGRSFGSKKSIDIVIPTGQFDPPDLYTKPYKSKTKQRERQSSRDFAMRQMTDDSEEETKKVRSKAQMRRKNNRGNIDIKGNKLEFLSDTSLGSTNTTPRHAKARSRDHSQSPKLSKASIEVTNLPDINVDYMKQKLLSIEAKQKSRMEGEQVRERKEKRKDELAKLLRTNPNGAKDYGIKPQGRKQISPQGVSFAPESWSEKYKRKNEDETMYWDSGDDNLDDEFDI